MYTCDEGGTIPKVWYYRRQNIAARARLGWINPLGDFIDKDPERDKLLNDF